MDKQTSFPAHIHPQTQTEQTVQQHCLETAALAEQYAEKTGLGKTARLAGILHDIGKLTADFGAYIHGDSRFRRGRLDHCFAGAKYLTEHAMQQTDAKQRKAAALIGRVILSHHGLHDWVQDDTKDYYQLRTAKEAYYAEIMQNFPEKLRAETEALLPQAAAEYSAVTKQLQALSEHAEAYAFYLGLLERLLLSALIDADRTNTADFMSASRTEAQFDTQKLWREMQQRMGEKLETFANNTDPISLQRKSISDRCAAFAAHDVGICKLIVPTGGGKTLSSLRFAVEYANQHPVERIIYVAPFLSILEQNSDVIRGIAGDEAFLEHHSNVLAEVSAAEDEEQLHEYELRAEKWDSPVIATTMVQFLNTLFSGKSSAVRRLHRLSRAVIIVDEVQSLPLKCVYLFDLAMNFLSKACGSTVVLCSATQPPFEQLQKFPLLLDIQDSMTGDTAADFAAFHRTKIIYQQKRGGYSYDEAAVFCKEKFAENGSLLIVVNTKAAAKELFDWMKDTDEAQVYHLSTNMCPQHRRDRIAEMKQALSAQQPVICVTTQLIEAGVDISFGCVVRSLAGMDNAAQAAGRCNRNGEYPKECPVYLIKLYEEKLGNLAEIKEAQNISELMLDQPAETDFLSVPLLSDYFGKLYQNAQNRKHQDLLRYPLPGKLDKDLLNLLALNEERISRNRNPQLKYCGQAFKTAGSAFQVIDSATTDVIVPYDEAAKKLITALGAQPDPRETAKLLRQLQKYTVSLYANDLQKLYDAGAVYKIQCGQSAESVVSVLDSRFYSEAFGVSAEGGLHEVLIM